MRHKLSMLFLMIIPCLLLGLPALGFPDGDKGPLSPRDEQATFKLLPGLVVELVASEPAVVDPVAFAFDEKGRLFVAEMHGYPNDGVGAGKVSSGKIKLLEDVDGDGFFEKHTIFADNLRLPNSVMPYHGGLLVCNAPDIIYLKDTDGDGKADVGKTLYTGFDLGNIQQMVNGLQWSLDNWIHGVAGSKGGNITSPEKPGQAVELRGRGIRFRPDQPGSLEPTTGGGQFGLAFDAYDNAFVNTNSQHVRQLVLPDRYLRRNPDLPVSAVTIDIADHGAACKVHRLSPFESWRVERTTRRKDSPTAGKFSPTELVPGGFVTSGCGPLIYDAEALPSQYRGNYFTCDPANNLIHRDLLERTGPLFVAKRADEGCEFLASTDNWFRPVFLATGPDGAIYVADFYREVIETPISLPDDIKAKVNLQSRSRGRIWRIRAEGKRPAPASFDKATTADLVACLEDANRWVRITAQRLLVERQDQKAVPMLELLAKDTRSTVGIVHALWTLDGLGAFHPKHAIRLTQEPNPEARMHALKLTERFLKSSREEDDPLFDYTPFRDLASDPMPQVRFQAAFSLADFPINLHRILWRDAADPWIRTAVFSSLKGPRPAAAQLSLFAVALLKEPTSGPEHQQVVRQLAFLIGGKGDDADLGIALGVLPHLQKHPSIQSALLEGLGLSLQSRKMSLAQVLEKPEMRLSARFFQQVIERAAERLASDKAPMQEKLDALKLVALGSFEVLKDLVKPLLTPQQPQEIQLAAIRALGQQTTPESAELLLEPWAGFSPSVRREVLETVLARPERVRVLLKALESKKVLAGQLEPAKVDLLRKHPNAEIRTQALKLLAGQIAPARQKVIDQYQSALDLKPDPVQGKAIFQKVCAACHRLENVGNEVGADLRSVLSNKTPERLLMDILDPSRDVDPRYIEYLVTTDAGKIMTGLIAAETASSITLRRAEKAEDVVLRSQIESIQSTAKSLMPEGLEMQLRPQDAADLIGYLMELGRKK